MKPNPDGIEALKEMLEEGKEVFIVSTSDPNFIDQCCAEKCQRVIENLGTDWLAWLVLTKDKTLVQGHVLIDDKPICTQGSIMPNWAHFLYTETYNQTFERKRLTNWADWWGVVGARIPLSLKDKTALYPNSIKFSCVFPSYNQYENVWKTLAGLVQQKFESDFKFEVVIVDNNSTDDIQKIYMDYRDKLDLHLIQHRKLKNTFSVPGSRNIWLLEAKYDYIIDLDSDVICNEYFLDIVYQFLPSWDPATPYMVSAEHWFVDTEPFRGEQVLKD